MQAQEIVPGKKYVTRELKEIGRFDASVEGLGGIEYAGNPSVVNVKGRERAVRRK